MATQYMRDAPASNSSPLCHSVVADPRRLTLYIRYGYITSVADVKPMTKRQDSAQSTLTPAVFYLLLALSDGQHHGYELMKKVKRDSCGAVRMGPGTLYGSIKRMLKQGLIEEAGEVAESTLGDERRRYYRATAVGRTALATELDRFTRALEVASARRRAKSAPGKKARAVLV
jgi:DNA-binding PadR family transcriptional regulator